MPCKQYACEFCGQVCRRNDLGAHTASKHKQDLAQMLIKEFKDTDGSISFTTIAKLLSGTKPINNPLYSQAYPDCFYFFGLKPEFFTEDENSHQYRNSPGNFEAHQTFLMDLIKQINLYDVYNNNLDCIIKSPEHNATKRELILANAKIRELEEQLKKEQSTSANLRNMMSELKTEKGLEPGESIQELKNDIKFYKSSYNDAQKELRHYQQLLETRAQEWENRYSEIKLNYAKKEEESWYKAQEKVQEMQKISQKEKEAVEKMKAKIEDEIEKKVKKKLQKEKEKRQKASEVAKKKKKEAEIAAKLAEGSDSDSSSSSDSE